MTLANALSAEGYDVVVHLLHERGQMDLRPDLDPRVRLRVAPWYAFPAVDKVPRLLITGTTQTELAAGLLWRSRHPHAGRWVVAHHHGAYPDVGVFSDRLARQMRLADGAIYLAESHRRALAVFQRLDKGRYWIAPNGSSFTCRPVALSSEGTLRLVSVGRLIASKRLDVIVAALSGMDDIPWLFDVYGDGPHTERLREQIPEPLRSRIRLRGWCPDPGSVLPEYDVFVLPSELEAQPMVILEAMAAGVTVMANAVGAVPEMLADGAGVIVAGIEPHLWRAALRQFADSTREERQQITVRAQKRLMEAYSVSQMVRRYVEVHDELLQDVTKAS